MNAYVVVEGSGDETFLRALLPREVLEGSYVVVAGERSNLSSVARSLLIDRRRPVAVVADSDSIDESLIHEKRAMMRDLVGAVSGGVPAKVILVVPTIEGVFFQAPAVLKKVFQLEIGDDFLLLAQGNPKVGLSQLLSRSKGPRTVPEFLKALDDEDLEALRSTGPIRELLDFLTSVASSSAHTSRT